MGRLIRAGAAALLAAAALAAGGCGGTGAGDANAYVAAVNAAQTEFGEASARLQEQIVPGETTGNRAAFRAFYAAVDDLVAELRGIEAPAGVQTLHEELIASMTRFGARLRVAGTKIITGNAGDILDGQEELAAASADVASDVNRTVAAINDELQG